METMLVLSPALGIRAAEVATAWNASQETRGVAEAHAEVAKGTQFDPSLADAAVVILSQVALGVAGNAVYEGVKWLLAQRGVWANVTPVPQPDGPPLLVATPVEGYAALRERLAELREGELRDLCFDLEVDYANLPGESKSDKARELLIYLRARRRVDALLARARALYTHVDWPSVGE